MSYTYSFFDDQTVGAYDLNNITKLFVSKGIEDAFDDGVPYSVTKLNDIVYSKGGDGIVPQNNDTLKVSVSDRTVTINNGTAFFEDGTVITITEPHKLKIEEEGKQYVYLKSSVEENKAYPVISTTEPSGNFVALAEITEEGEIIDKRTYAKGKVPSVYASDAGIALKATKVISEPVEEVVLSEGANTYNYYLIRIFSGGKAGILWHAYIFINKENPEQSFYSFEFNTTTYMYKLENTDEFHLVKNYFTGTSVPSTITAKFITDDGIKLQLSYERYEDFQSTYDYYVFPFQIDLYAF